MGQALRRAIGRVRPSRLDPPLPPAQRPVRPSAAADPPSPAASSTDAPEQLGVPDAEVTVTIKHESSVLEERDPKYDEMLKQMAGRVTSRPGGKLVMGEAVVRKAYTRPLPKLRSSTAEPGASEQKPLPPGTLSIEHVRQIILLHQGKAEDHPSKMDVRDIAKRYGVDVEHVQQIIQFMSLPPEEDAKKNHSNS